MRDPVYGIIRNLLFLMEPERAHKATLRLLSATAPLGAGCLMGARRMPAMPCRVMGIEFPNPVGLAAGLDKDGECITALGQLGFGFIEVGTVTPRPQPGNTRPRVFRIVQRQALINRLGFNNKGVDHLIRQVRRSGYGGILGINIGKNFDTPVERAVEDYIIGLRKVYAHASYVVVNISSPNTPQLRTLQHGLLLDELLSTLKAEQRHLAVQHDRYVPLVVKIAPDLDDKAIDVLAQQLLEHAVDGVTATNSTLSREGVEGLRYGHEGGGLSGAPLFDRSTRVLRRLNAAFEGHMPLIGVGGIVHGADAVQKMKAGADLLQVYTGLVYRGPELIGEIIQALAEQGVAQPSLAKQC
ncbi:MAG TPA: quinone-dependent dihydroorotate dehydrogenase [Nitrococcus sp.]|nr:quinone-dependent dihydroorotate dehydrogenase [Nitrococcus sp.]